MPRVPPGPGGPPGPAGARAMPRRRPAVRGRAAVPAPGGRERPPRGREGAAPAPRPEAAAHPVPWRPPAPYDRCRARRRRSPPGPPRRSARPRPGRTAGRSRARTGAAPRMRCAARRHPRPATVRPSVRRTRRAGRRRRAGREARPPERPSPARAAPCSAGPASRKSAASPATRRARSEAPSPAGRRCGTGTRRRSPGPARSFREHQSTPRHRWQSGRRRRPRTRLDIEAALGVSADVLWPKAVRTNVESGLPGCPRPGRTPPTASPGRARS